MGRRAREERQEKREDYAAKISKNKRKTTLMAVGILALIGVIVGYAIFVFMTQVDTSGALGAPDGAGRLGDEHEHASVLVRIFGDKLDFSSPAYQIKSSWIHFEDSDGTTIHRHSSGVTLGYLFDTLNIGIDIQLAETHDTVQEKLEYIAEEFKNRNECEMTYDEYGNRSDECGLLSDAYMRCFIFPDGREFCTNEDYSLKYYINHKPVSNIYDYVLEDEDRILISFGPETPEEIEEQLIELDSQIIKG